MDIERAINKAEVCLNAAERALGRLTATESRENMQDHWEFFLYKTAQATKAIGKIQDHRFKSQIDAFKSLQSSDPLLNYLYQARNAADHGLRAIVRQRVLLPVVVRTRVLTEEEERALQELLAAQKRVGIVLRDVESRGTTIPVPAHHQGQLISRGLTPERAGALAIETYRELLQGIKGRLAALHSP